MKTLNIKENLRSLAVLATSYAMTGNAEAQPTACTPTEAAPVCIHQVKNTTTGVTSMRMRWLNNRNTQETMCYEYTVYSLATGISIANIKLTDAAYAGGPPTEKSPLIPKFGGGDKYRSDVYYRLTMLDGSCVTEGDYLWHLGSAWITFPKP